MPTTIQIVESIQTEKFVTIDGKRCEVERIENAKVIDQRNALSDLVAVMSTELLLRGVIDKDQAGAYFWADTGEYLVPEKPFED